MGEPGKDKTRFDDSGGSGAATAVAAGPRLKPAVADAVSQIWAGVFIKPAGEAPRIVVVTSAERHEGATEIAAALGLVGSSAQEGLRIALVDFNFRHPRLAETLGGRTSPGIVDVIGGTARLDDVLVRVGGDLAVLPPGKAPANPLSLLRNERVRAVLNELAGRFDHTIIDAPAINRYPDAAILGGLASGVVLVARSARTPRETVAEAKRRVEHAGGTVLGVVLNRRAFPIPGFLYRRL